MTLKKHKRERTNHVLDAISHARLCFQDCCCALAAVQGTTNKISTLTSGALRYLSHLTSWPRAKCSHDLITNDERRPGANTSTAYACQPWFTQQSQARASRNGEAHVKYPYSTPLQRKKGRQTLTCRFNYWINSRSLLVKGKSSFTRERNSLY